MLHIEPYRDADRLQTAALIYAAFCDKFQRARRLSPRLQWRLFYRLWSWKQGGSRERSFVVKQDEQVVAAFALNAAAGENNAGRRPHALPIWRLCRRYGWLNVWRLYLQMAALRHTPAADELYLLSGGGRESARQRGGQVAAAVDERLRCRARRGPAPEPARQPAQRGCAAPVSALWFSGAA